MLIGQNHITMLLDSEDKFKKIAKEAHSYLLQDGVNLNFKGYTEALYELSYIDEVDTEDLLKGLKTLSLWKQYIADINNIINSELQKYENKFLYIKGFEGSNINCIEEFNRELSEVNKRILCYKKCYVFFSRVDRVMGESINDLYSMLYECKKKSI